MPVTGYDLHHLVRMTPQNGSAETYNLRTLMSDARGPVRTRLDWPPDIERREDVNRRGRSRVWGFRLNCTMTFDIMTMTDQAYLVTITERLGLRGLWMTELSLDAGATYHEVELVSYRGPDPLGGKTFAGGRFELGLRGIELLSQPPSLASSLGAAVYTDVGTKLPDAELFQGALFEVLEPGQPSRHYISTRSAGGAWVWELFREGPPS